MTQHSNHLEQLKQDYITTTLQFLEKTQQTNPNQHEITQLLNKRDKQRTQLQKHNITPQDFHHLTQRTPNPAKTQNLITFEWEQLPIIEQNITELLQINKTLNPHEPPTTKTLHTILDITLQNTINRTKNQ